MSFHHHMLPNGLNIIGEPTLGRIGRPPSVSSSAPARAMRRREFPASRISWSTWCSRGRPGERPRRQPRFRPDRRQLQRLHQRREHRLLRRHLARVFAAGGRHPGRHPAAEPARRGLRHGEEGHHRRDRHVRRPAEVVRLRSRQEGVTSPIIRWATASWARRKASPL